MNKTNLRSFKVYMRYFNIQGLMKAYKVQGQINLSKDFSRTFQECGDPEDGLI